MMRALTLTQPWAGLVASGIKLIENRPRRMIKAADFGKPFAIHASKTVDDSVYARICEIAPWLALGESNPQNKIWYPLSRLTSAVIAVATIEREVFSAYDINKKIFAVDASWRNRHRPPQPAGPTDLGDQARWFFGSIGYVLRDVVALREPVPCRGWQGFWTLEADVEAKVREQLERSAA